MFLSIPQKLSSELVYDSEAEGDQLTGAIMPPSVGNQQSKLTTKPTYKH